MIRTIVVAAAFCAGALAAQAGSSSAAAPQAPQASSLQDLVAKMKEREGSVESAVMEMVMRGRYPGDVSFEIQGTVRVLGKTHFHSTNRTSFGDEVTVESERVKTPEGVWMREQDPAFGEVFLRMEPALVAELEAAQAVLAEGMGTMENSAQDPLGSAMLEGLDREFALDVQRRTIQGREFYVVQGPARAGAGPAEPSDLPMPDRVELLVRTPDLAVVRMTQFRQGREMMQVEITRLELNRPLDKASFRIDLPAGARFVDIRDHLPAWTQIEQMLERAAEKKAEKAEQEKGK